MSDIGIETASGPRLSREEILAGIERFASLRAVVLGDFFVDEYIEGEMFEISKEGPIPVVRLDSRIRRAGAAGNLASSIANLGAQVAACGIAGTDANGDELVAELEGKGIDCSSLLRTPEQPTWTYTKIRARVENAPSREILRLDVLPRGPLAREREVEILERLDRALEGADALIVLDQVHHLVTDGILDALPALARRHGALLHGSSRSRIGRFRSFDLITPNDQEAKGAVGGSTETPEDIARMGLRLKEAGGHAQVILTLGARGMALFPRSGPVHFLPSLAREVADVTGAGDALSSVALLGNALGWDLVTLGWTASLAAAEAIAHVGTHHVRRDELRRRVDEALQA